MIVFTPIPILLLESEFTVDVATATIITVPAALYSIAMATGIDEIFVDFWEIFKVLENTGIEALTLMEADISL